MEKRGAIMGGSEQTMERCCLGVLVAQLGLSMMSTVGMCRVSGLQSFYMQC